MTVNQEDLDKQDFVCYTTKLVTFGLTWTIEGIPSLCGDSCTGIPMLRSEQFKPSPSKQIVDSKNAPVRFEMWLFPRGCSAQNPDFVGLFLYMTATDNSTDAVPCKYWFSVVDTNGDKRLICSGSNLFKPNASTWGNHQAICRTELLDPTKGFLQANGNLVIHCKVGIYKCICDEPKPLTNQTLTEQQQPQLVDKMNQAIVPSWDKSIEELLDSGAHSDVSLVLVDDGGQELRAHKWILAARSRVFADMFESNSGAKWSWWRAAKLTNRVEINKTRVEVFKQVLHFIYTGKVGTSLDGIAKDLLACAHKYQLNPLKSICEEYLVGSGIITTDSDLSDLLTLSILPESSKLNAKVLDLLRKKFEAQLQKTDKMQQLNRFLSNLATDKKN